MTFAERGEPFQYAVEVAFFESMNPWPAMKSVNDSLPAVMLDGKSPVIIGVGFGWTVLDPQPDANIATTASAPSAVHRKRIKPVLLLFSPVVFTKTGAAIR